MLTRARVNRLTRVRVTRVRVTRARVIRLTRVRVIRIEVSRVMVTKVSDTRVRVTRVRVIRVRVIRVRVKRLRVTMVIPMGSEFELVDGCLNHPSNQVLRHTPQTGEEEQVILYAKAVPKGVGLSHHSHMGGGLLLGLG